MGYGRPPFYFSLCNYLYGNRKTRLAVGSLHTGQEEGLGKVSYKKRGFEEGEADNLLQVRKGKETLKKKINQFLAKIVRCIPEQP